MRYWTIPFLMVLLACGSSKTGRTPVSGTPAEPTPPHKLPEPPKPKPATASDREDYAQRLTDIYLDNSMRVNVKASGKDKTTVTITYVLMDEVFIHQFMKTKSTEAMRKLGFTRLNLSSGYPSYYIWHYDLVKDDWFPDSKAK